MSRLFLQSLSRRQMLKWMGISSASLFLSACAPAAATPQPAAEEAAGAEPQPAGKAYEEGELKVFVCCYTPPEVELRNQFNASFMEAHPGVQVVQELLPAGQNYFEKLQTLVAAGTPPDLFDMWEGYVQPYAANGVLLNLDPFFEKDDKVKKDDLLPAAKLGGSWQDSVYAFSIGFMPGPISVYYNVDHFQKAGLPDPSSDWKWDDLKEAAQALTVDSNGDGMPEQWGLVFDLWFVPWLYWIWSNGGDVFNKDETQCTLTDSAAVEAIQYWADLVNVDGVAIPTAELQAMQGSLNSFQTGVVSMYLGNTWDVGQLKEARKQGLNWKAVLSPTANNGGRIWYEHFWCWSMSSQTKKPNIGWLYLRDFILNRTIDAATPTIPPLRQLLDTFNTETNKELGYEPLIVIATEPDRFRIPGAGAKWDKISGLIQAELDLVFTGEKSAAEAAAAACPKVNEELART